MPSQTRSEGSTGSSYGAGGARNRCEWSLALDVEQKATAALDHLGLNWNRWQPASGAKVAGVASTIAGRLIERGGAHAGMITTAAFSGGACLGVAVLARSWVHLAGFLALAGVANAFAQPAANTLLKRVVSDRRQGTVFGVKQAAIPAATLLAGVAVPVVGLTVGWRWGFVLCVGTAVGVALVAPREDTRVEQGPGRQSTGGRALAPLLTLAAAGALGAAPTMSLGVFLVASAVAGGVSQAAAGLLLAVGSLAGVASRLVKGVLADRRDGGHLRAVVGMLVAGAIGLALLGLGHVPALLVVGTVLASVRAGVGTGSTISPS